MDINAIEELSLHWLQWPWRSVQEAEFGESFFNGGRSAKGKFVEHIRRSSPAVKRDHIEWLVDEFFNARPSLTELYRSVLRAKSIALAFNQNMAVVDRLPGGSFESWLRLTSMLDPDTFITLASVQHNSRPINPSEWGMSPISADRDLQRLFSKGLSDLHIHLGGMRAIPYLWLQFIQGDSTHKPLALQDLFVHELREDLEEQDIELLGLAKSIVDKSKIARVDSDDITGRLSSLFRLNSSDFFKYNADSGPMPLPPGQVLREEREMLCNVWRYLDTAQSSDEGYATTERALDIYLSGKHLFRRHFLHELGDVTPGLRQFRGLFRRTKEGIYRTRKFRSANGLNIAWLADNPNLRRAEIRISPLPKWADYYRYLMELHQLLGELKERRGRSPHPKTAFDGPADRRKRNVPPPKNIDVRVAIHLLRSLPTDQNANSIPHKLSQIDRQTASIHWFRLKMVEIDTPESLTCLKLLSRIDVAAEERGAPAHIFLPHIKLLRGDTEALKQLRCDQNPVHTETYTNWLTAFAEKDLPGPRNLPKLGLTFHAGEDYYSPVDGLWQIATVIDGLSMEAGDGLGHGLALGINYSDFVDQKNIRDHIPVGIQFDSLLWLLEYSYRHQCDAGSRELISLESWLRDTSKKIYGQSTQNVDLITLRQKTNTIGQLIQKKIHPTNTTFTATDYQYADLFDNTVVEERTKLTRICDVQSKIGGLFESVQSHLQNRLINKGVVLETNPSSNWRIGNADKLASLPIVNLLNSPGGNLRATICTDDPGIFDTRIETEYALLFEALGQLDNSLDREQRLDILESIRINGLERVNW